MAVEIIFRIAVVLVLVLAILCAIERGRDEDCLEAALRGFFLGLLGGSGAVLALLITAAGCYFALTGRWLGA